MLNIALLTYIGYRLDVDIWYYVICGVLLLYKLVKLANEAYKLGKENK